LILVKVGQIDVTDCSPIERIKLIVSAKLCSVNAPLIQVRVSTLGGLTVTRALTIVLTEDW
jgi:hypothetical protein